jgi:predicted amidohydrolase YtcJ
VKLLTNARIYTLNPSQPQASALLVEGDRVRAIGDDSLRAEFPHAQVQDMGGMTILPGLTDAHVHLQHYALGLQYIDCETETRAECLARVSARAAQTEPGAWVLGHGWNQNMWAEGFGNVANLDAAAPRNPVYLTAKSLHAAWANSAALRLAGIDDATPDPLNGKIVRDAKGRATGILLETAMELVARAIPPATPAQIARAIEAAQPVLWKMGITGVHDFDRRDCFLALQSLRASGKLGLRVLKNLPVDDLPHAEALGLSHGLGDDLLRVGAVKVFMDGALGPRTAAMFQPYLNEAENRGILNMDGEELFEIGRRAAQVGLGLTVHAIGDRANHETLNAFEQLRRYERENGLPALPHRVEHVQILHPDDVKRLAELGAVASMQPLHATSDMLMADQYWGKRTRYAYAIRTQLQAGATLVFGSDAPVESPNPFWGMHAAVTRQSRAGAPAPEGWHPQEKISLADALHAYTVAPAQVAGWADRVGQLLPGFYADLIVLENDPFALPVSDLHTIQASATMFAGKWVFAQ